MIVRLIDKRQIRVDNTQAARISELIDQGVEWILLPTFGRIRTHQIISVEKDNVQVPFVPTQPLLPAPSNELSEDERQHKLGMVDKLRSEFFDKRNKAK